MQHLDHGRLGDPQDLGLDQRRCRRQVERLPRKGSLAHEIAHAQKRDDGRLALLGQDGDLHLAFPDLVDAARRIALSEQRGLRLVDGKRATRSGHREKLGGVALPRLAALAAFRRRRGLATRTLHDLLARHPLPLGFFRSRPGAHGRRQAVPELQVSGALGKAAHPGRCAASPVTPPRASAPGAPGSRARPAGCWYRGRRSPPRQPSSGSRSPAAGSRRR